MRISLAAARVNANLTQEEAGRRIGVARGTIQNWESGKTFPSTPQVKKIEEVYGCSYDDIVFA